MADSQQSQAQLDASGLRKALLERDHEIQRLREELARGVRNSSSDAVASPPAEGPVVGPPPVTSGMMAQYP